MIGDQESIAEPFPVHSWCDGMDSATRVQREKRLIRRLVTPNPNAWYRPDYGPSF